MLKGTSWRKKEDWKEGKDCLTAEEGTE